MLVPQCRVQQGTGRYVTRYAETAKWRFALGAIEGRTAMPVSDGDRSTERPAHFALPDWRDDRIAAIRDFLFAPYVVEAIDWVRPAEAQAQG